MKLIPENINLLRRHGAAALIALGGFFQSVTGQSTVPDTLVSPPAIEDSAQVIEQPDTTIGSVRYFDHVTNGGELDSTHFREVPAGVIDSLRRDDAFWYANKAFHKKKLETRDASDARQAPRWMSMTTLVIIVAIFIALLLTYLFQNNIIRRRSAILSSEKDVEISEENIFEINYQREIDRAVSAANYRLAIRLMFLRLLKKLSEENIIQYKHERTNSDYLMQLASTAFYADFFRLTREFEYTWYGKFDVDTVAFRHIQSDFEKFDQKLR